MKAWKHQILFLSTLLALFLVAAYGVSGFFLPASASPRRIFVDVPAGATASQIAARLEQQHLIRDRYAFLLLAKLMGYASQLKAGEYAIDPSQGVYEILEKLARGDAIAHWVTIPEGLTIRDIALTLEKNNLANAHRFLDIISSGARRFSPGEPIPTRSLEGYLFPDTYKFRTGTSEQAMVRTMVANFRRRVTEGLADQIRRSQLPLHEIITIAAMIEREAKVPEDRPKIAAVIFNRLRRNMRLEVDATLLYALGRQRFIDFARDKKVDSPYNTYRCYGLPPGPICNPGLDSIRAVLSPAQVGYLYYVAQANGVHVFAYTYAEHRENCRRVREGQSSG